MYMWTCASSHRELLRALRSVVDAIAKRDEDVGVGGDQVVEARVLGVLVVEGRLVLLALLVARDRREATATTEQCAKTTRMFDNYRMLVIKIQFAKAAPTHSSVKSQSNAKDGVRRYRLGRKTSCVLVKMVEVTGKSIGNVHILSLIQYRRGHYFSCTQQNLLPDCCQQ